LEISNASAYIVGSELVDAFSAVRPKSNEIFVYQGKDCICLRLIVN